MKKIKQIGLSVITSFMLISTFTISTFAQETEQPYGSGATTDDKEYSIEEMLRYAIEDEYVAQAEYQLIIENFGNTKPFSNIVKAEATHISKLKPLLETYKIDLPADIANKYIALPATLGEAYTVGVEAEIKNIAMYDKFLAQSLPDDVRVVFEYLKQASEKHLKAFERNVERANGTITKLGQGKGRNR